MVPSHRSVVRHGRWVVVVSCLGLLAFLAARNGAEEAKPPAGGKYIGVEKCKNCHQAEKTGNQYAKWQHMKHAEAYETLATDEAKKVGKEHGVDDPQKSEKCLRCHQTAFGEPAERLGRTFDPKLGIQCETCHGAGGKHEKARIAAAGESDDKGGGFGEEEKAYQKLPAGEIVDKPFVDTCVKCHNKDAPSFKNKCATKVFKEVMHFDPRKKRTEADLATEKKRWEKELETRGIWCGGPEKCEECKKACTEGK